MTISELSDHDSDAAPQLSVVIIAYNEEDRIRECIESVFNACRDVDGFEVILVDSNSTDRTVEYATEYPITVLRIPSDDLTTPSAGRYVGTQVASAERILFVDGDMELTETWLPEAMVYLEAHDDVAAVEGCLNSSTQTGISEADKLGGAMLSDAEALDEIGGFDPYLRSNEDIDVGFRLRAAGYRLVRLPEVSVIHPEDDTISEPIRRWGHGYYIGQGQILRNRLGSPTILRWQLRRQRYKLGLLAWLSAGVVSLFVTPLLLLWTLLSLLGFGIVASRRGVMRSVTILTAKTFGIAGLFIGLTRPIPPAEEYPLSAVEVVATGRTLAGPARNGEGIEGKDGSPEGEKPAGDGQYAAGNRDDDAGKSVDN